jgi:hypothetical protein
MSTLTLARAYQVDQPARAESLAREALKVRENQSPDEWLTFASSLLRPISSSSWKSVGFGF